jgi:hypothetical protein
MREWRDLCILFINEAPVHFAVVVIICVITLIVMVLSLLSVARAPSEQRLTRWFGVLFVLFIFLMYVVFAVSLAIFPVSAGVSELLLYYQVIWGFAGLHGFCIILYSLGYRFLRERMRLFILIMLGGAVYVVLLFLLPNPLSAIIVTDGVLNYVAMPLALVGYAAILGAIYMFLVPLLVTIRMTKKAEGNTKLGMWLGWIGLVLSFVASILISAVQFTASFILFSFGLVAVAWLVIALGAILMGLLSKPAT